MKVMILANPDSIHTRRWVIALCENHIEIVLFSLHDFEASYYAGLKNFKSYSLQHEATLNKVDNKFRKLAYLTAVSKIKKTISAEKPDILHSHYASSFGLLGALSKFHPFIISVWGSDIYDFPKSSWIAKKILQYNLSNANKILSTSHAMAIETEKYTHNEIEVTPFGVDLAKFCNTRNRNSFNDADLVIGTIKSFEKVYGITFLIKAFAKVVIQNPGKKMKLLLVGNGSCQTEYKALASELKISDQVVFTGYIDHSEIVSYYNQIDIFVVPSLRESFGVSVLEASSCEIPVIVSDTGGLPEVVLQNKTGFIVQCGNVYAIAEAIQTLIDDHDLRHRMGENGRKMVSEKYEWSLCVKKMTDIYHAMYKRNSSGL